MEEDPNAGSPAAQSGMTREQQTSRIVKTIFIATALLLGGYWMMENKREYEKRWPGCWQPIGEDLGCKAEVSARRLGLR
jgi:hypothetical protein